jgi:hypothetical protein
MTGDMNSIIQLAMILIHSEKGAYRNFQEKLKFNCDRNSICDAVYGVILIFKQPLVFPTSLQQSKEIKRLITSVNVLG